MLTTPYSIHNGGFRIRFDCPECHIAKYYDSWENDAKFICRNCDQHFQPCDIEAVYNYRPNKRDITKSPIDCGVTTEEMTKVINTLITPKKSRGIKSIKSWMIVALGLKGSWRWACRQMDKGHVVYRTSNTGTVKHRLDLEGQRRITYTFKRKVSESGKYWEPAIIFLSKFESTDWAVYRGE